MCSGTSSSRGIRRFFPNDITPWLWSNEFIHWQTHGFLRRRIIQSVESDKICRIKLEKAISPVGCGDLRNLPKHSCKWSRGDNTVLPCIHNRLEGKSHYSGGKTNSFRGLPCVSAKVDKSSDFYIRASTIRINSHLFSAD